jgi:hypothetical protein
MAWIETNNDDAAFFWFAIPMSLMLDTNSVDVFEVFWMDCARTRDDL